MRKALVAGAALAGGLLSFNSASEVRVKQLVR